MKYYVVRNEADPEKLAVIGASGFIPSGVIAEAPIDPLTGEIERPEFLQLEQVLNDETKQLETVVTVNLVGKVKAEELQRDREEQQRVAKEKVREKKSELTRRIKEARKKDVTGVLDVQNQIKLLWEAIDGLTTDFAETQETEATNAKDLSRGSNK